MNRSPDTNPCAQAELACAYAMQALSASEAGATKTHIGECECCRREFEALRPVMDSFVHWPTDVLRPTASLQERLAQRLAVETGREPVRPAERRWIEPEWDEVAPGIYCKILSHDAPTHRVSMLVHLEPGVEYPPHTHAGVEELHLLDGELWIDERKLYSGDYNRAEPGTGDKRVWSETGCTCVLITSSEDQLG